MKTNPLRDRLLLAFLALVVWLPLALGRTVTFLYGVTAFWAGLILLVWLVQYARGRRRIPVAARRAWPALLILAAWLLFVLLQLVPLPLDLVAAISPKAAWAHQLTYHPGQGEPWVTLSVDPHRTLVSLHRSVTLALFFLLVLLLVRRFSHLRWLAGALVFAGTLTAVLGLAGYLLGWKSMYDGSLTATFANRNHLADYLALCIAAGIGLLLAQMGEGGAARERRELLRRTLDWIMSGKMRLRAYLLLMTVAIILTHSRMGNTAFFVSLLVAGILALLLMRRKTRGMVILLASLVVIDIFIVGSFVGINRVVERLEKTSLAHETRDEVVRDTITYWRDFPTTGSGLGTFPIAFPLYKGSDIPLTYRTTHNDYLQFASESGTLGLLLVGGFVVLSLAVSLLALRKRRVPWAQGAAFALLMGSVALLIHSSVEFNLQMLANAATYMILAGMGWVALFLPAEGQHCGIARRRKRHLLALAGGILVLLHLVGVARLTAADLLTEQNEWLLERWDSRQEFPWQQVEAALERQSTALRLSPRNVEATLMAVRLLDLERRTQPLSSREEREKTMDRMLLLLLEATRQSPLLATSWIAIARLRHFQRRYDAFFLAALLRASQLAPWEYRVQLELARVGFRAWENLPALARRTTLEALRHVMVQKPDEAKELIEKLGRKELVCGPAGGKIFESLCPGEK